MRDLTVGKPLKVLWSFSLPLLLSTALQQLYNIADSIILGRFTGSSGLASIGAAYPITLFYVAVATGASMGSAVVISQLYGARDMRRMKSAVFTAILSLCSLGAALALLGMALAGPLMRLLGTPDAIFGGSRTYLTIYSVGVLPMLAYNTVTAVYTGLGDSRTPLYFLILSSVLHIILDLLAVGKLGLGVAGVAWSTVLSQLVAAGLSAALMTKKILAIPTDGKAQLFDRSILRDMTRIALPAIFQQSCVALAHTILQSLVNSFDTIVIAGYEAASKLHNFAYMSFNTLGTALSSYTAQCWGAGKKSRILEGFRTSTAMCFVLTLAVIAVFQTFPAQLIGIFVDAEAEPAVVAVGVNYLRIISPMYALICFIITIGGLLRGVGRSLDFFIETVIEFTIRVSMCFVLTGVLASYTGLMWAWYFGSPCGFLMCVFLFLRLRRRELAS